VGIFSKALQKMRKDGIPVSRGTGSPRAELSDGLQVAKDHTLTKVVSDDNPPAQDELTPPLDELPEFDIDIRLDHDLSDYAEASRYARSREAELDFDLGEPGSEELSFIETQVMSINPTKSFSQQLDINLREFGRAGYITPDESNSELSHTFRQLKRPLLNNVLGRGATVLDNANLVMVTSSFAGEGKTFSAINLAISIAMERDQQVLLIDADVNKPSHHKIFGAESATGLTDLLTGRVEDVSKVMYKTNIPSLSLMFAGSRTPHATELFASKAMETFVSEISNRYKDRVIIFDSAPLLLPTEAGVLASHMGQVILVVEAEKTRNESVRQSVDTLTNRIVLLLLNKMREKSNQSAYGHYGSYEN
jgi:protein-tyrosine kinase